MKKISTIGLVIALLFSSFLVSSARAGTVLGYEDHRSNPTTNFEMPLGAHVYAEYSDTYIKTNRWDFQDPGGYPNQDASNQDLPVDVKGNDFRKILFKGVPLQDSPTAGFHIEVIAPDGSVRSSADCEDGSTLAASSPRIRAQVGDTIKYSDYSSPADNGGTAITHWDFQYAYLYVLPEGQEDANGMRFYSYPVSGVAGWPEGVNSRGDAIMATSPGQVSSFVQEIQLDRPGYLQLYLGVEDNALCGPYGSNWSTNGNYVVKGEPNLMAGFPWYCWWYYTSLIVEVEGGSGLDLMVTGNGSSHYQREYSVRRESVINPQTLYAEPVNRFDVVYAFHNLSSAGQTAVPYRIVACLEGSESEGYVIEEGDVDIPAEGKTADVWLKVDYDALGLGDEYQRQPCVAVILDPENSIAESDEENNIALFRPGEEQPVLSIEAYSPPDGFPVHSTGWASITVSRKDDLPLAFEALVTWEISGDPMSKVITISPGSGIKDQFNVTHYSDVAARIPVNARVDWTTSEGDQEAVGWTSIIFGGNYVPNVPPPPEYEDDVIVGINGG